MNLFRHCRQHRQQRAADNVKQFVVGEPNAHADDANQQQRDTDRIDFGVFHDLLQTLKI